jgi:hypothetical protein
LQDLALKRDRSRGFGSCQIGPGCDLAESVGTRNVRKLNTPAARRTRNSN